MIKLLKSPNVFSFCCSHKHNNGQPIWFTLGILEALKGWDQGLKGMCVGEKRKVQVQDTLLKRVFISVPIMFPYYFIR